MFERFASEFANGRAGAGSDPWIEDHLAGVSGFILFIPSVGLYSLGSIGGQLAGPCA